MFHEQQSCLFDYQRVVARIVIAKIEAGLLNLSQQLAQTGQD
ncbi:hypothetical protein [Sodalis sp.]